MHPILKVLTILAIFGPAAAAAEERLVEFTGSGNQLTDEFEVEGPWLLDWFVTSEYPNAMGIEITLVDSIFLDHKGIVAKTRWPDSGTRLFYDTGRLRLRVVATFSDWRLRISTLTDEEAEAMIPVRPGQRLEKSPD